VQEVEKKAQGSQSLNSAYQQSSLEKQNPYRAFPSNFYFF
jgi:hypothetical protein